MLRRKMFIPQMRRGRCIACTHLGCVAAAVRFVALLLLSLSLLLLLLLLLLHVHL